MKTLATFLAAAVVAAANAQDVKQRSSEFDSKAYFESKATAVKLQSDDELSTGLRLVRDKQTGAVEWQATLVAVYYGTRRGYGSASLIGGQVLPAANHQSLVLGCYRGSCQLAEQLLVTIPVQTVERAMKEGLRVRWNASAFGSFETMIDAADFNALASSAAR